MPKIITCASQKGGVHKTTTAVNLSHALALKGKSVALLDLDSQGQCATRLGFDPTSSAYNFLTGQSYELIPALDNLRLIAANSEMVKAERWSYGEVASATSHINELARGYDYLVIDTPPVGIRQEIALRVADILIVPVLCESPSLEGVANILDLARQIGHQQKVIILPSNFDRRWVENEYNVNILRDRFGSAVFQPVLRRLAMAEAVAYGKTCYNYDAPKRQHAIQPIRESFFSLANLVDESEVICSDETP